MTAMFRIALANLHHPASPAESVDETTTAIATAAKAGARVVCFPECFVPGYRSVAKAVPPPNARFLEDAWRVIGAAAKAARSDRGARHRAPGWRQPARLGAGDRAGRNAAGIPGQGADRSLGGGDLCAGKRASSISGWPAPLRGGDLPRGVALPRDGPVGGEGGRAGGLPPAVPRGRARVVPAEDVSGTRPTASMRRRCCAGRRKTAVTSRR